MIEEFRKQLIDTFNNSPLSADIKYYIFKDVYRDIAEAYQKILIANKEEKDGVQQCSQ